MQLSYIIPVYNSANFLDACLNSIVAQKLDTSQYEIVIVNDGSIDNSEDVIKNWHLQNSSVSLKYVYQENKGQGAARNAAIKKAAGYYLWFIDSDDFIESECANILLGELDRNDLDCIWFNHRLIDIFGNVFDQPPIDIKTDSSQEVYKGDVFLAKVFGTSCMPVMFIFKRELIITNSIYFHEGIYFEDIIFTIKLIFFSKRIKYFDLLVYNYLIHGQSTMRSSDNLKKRAFDSIVVVKELLTFSKIHNNTILSKYINKYTSEILMFNYRLVIAKNDFVFLDQFTEQMKAQNLYPFRIVTPFKIALLAKVANLSPFIFKKLSQLRPIR